jgi:hypothetical protein
MHVRGRSGAAGRVAAGASLVALLAVAAFALPLVWPALAESQRRVRLAIHFRNDSASAAEARFRGERYVGAIERIRATIPPDGAYLLVDTEGHEDNWVRFDLAPRRPVFLGVLKDRMTDAAFEKPPQDAPLWVVVARRVEPGPEIFETAQFFASAKAP